MSRTAIVTLVCMAVLAAVVAAPARAQLVEETYLLTYETTTTGGDPWLIGVLVEEKVFDALGGGYLYQYFVINDLTDPAQWGMDEMGLNSEIFEFGYSESLDGGPINVFGTGPNGSWSVAGDGGGSPQPVWSTSTVNTGIGDPDAQDNFQYISNGPPHSMYEAYVIAAGPDGLFETDDDMTATGEISGPTPEPCTLALLGLGLSGAGMIRLLKRRRE